MKFGHHGRLARAAVVCHFQLGRRQTRRSKLYVLTSRARGAFFGYATHHFP
jgi:hypothetical protein